MAEAKHVVQPRHAVIGGVEQKLAWPIEVAEVMLVVGAIRYVRRSIAFTGVGEEKQLLCLHLDRREFWGFSDLLE